MPSGKRRFHSPRQIVRTRDRGLGFKMWAPERVVERQTGCYNCLHFLPPNDPKTLARKEELRRGVLAKAIEDNGGNIQAAEEKVTQLLDGTGEFQKAVRAGGLCLKGATPSDLVHPAYKCAKWTGRIRPEGPGDELIEDIKDRLGD